MSRRDFLKFAGIGVGSAVMAYGFGGWLKDKIFEYQENSAPPQGVDENFVVPEISNITPQATAEPTQAAEVTQNPENPTPTPEVKPIVDGFKIAEKIDLSNGDPMEWLLVTNDNKAILTPSARPYAYSVENQQKNLFDWHNHTTYAYLEEHGLPIMWGHEGQADLFFDYWANLLRKPGDSGYIATRADAEKAMVENIIGASVYMLQSPDAKLLPGSPQQIGSMDSSVNIVEAKVVAGLFIPRWQKMSNMDVYGNPTDKSQVTFDGSGSTVDFVTTMYNSHTMDILNWIKKAYPDDPKDYGQTNKLFSPLPKPNLVMAKFCMRSLSGDLAAPERDANGRPVTPTSYGRFFLVLEIKGA